jgi:hypothetical protein
LDTPDVNVPTYSSLSSFMLSQTLANRLLVVDDTRWTFKDETLFPRPRPYRGIVKEYKSGSKDGSPVPLDPSRLTQ